jgi:hypothetical protein
MARLGLSVILGLATLLMPWASPREANALSCAEMSAEHHVQRAEVVFVGVVLSLGPPPLRNDEAHVIVERYLKGGGPTEVTVVKPGTADFPFMGVTGWEWNPNNLGRRYVFFAETEGDHYNISPCIGSRPIAGQSDEFLDEVRSVTGPGVAPGQENVSAANGPSAFDGAWAVGAGALLIAGGALAVVYAWRKRQ